MSNTTALSARAEATTRRTYNRPQDDEGTVLENWGQSADRFVTQHQTRLWSEQVQRPLLVSEKKEIAEQRSLAQDRLGMPSGRTMWLGGTEYAFTRPACQFNCAFEYLRTVYDMVDAAWLLLGGSGVGGHPQAGTLRGYNRPIPELEVIPSDRPKDYKGRQENIEERPSESNGWTWTIRVGDSAQSWAKAWGKMFVPPSGRCDKLRLDYSEIRGPGGRLKGYGWICNGYLPLAEASVRLHAILNGKAGQLLDEIDIGDAHNLKGTVLSSRRAAEILSHNAHSPLIERFKACKDNYYLCRACGHWDTKGGICQKCGSRDNYQHRRQSNNSIFYWTKPSREELASVLEHAYHNGDPAPVNAAACLRKCPWFSGSNPCFEILLSDKGFCNLVTNALPRFRGDFSAILRSIYITARANYRQTCVNLQDGILQPSWHQTNESLRLCGVSATGIAQMPWLTDYQIRQMRNAAINGAYSMADELGLPRPKAVCTIKPEGTASKICDVSEGIHTPLGRYIFNWIAFSKVDPLVEALAAAGYRTIPSPSDPNNTLVCFPVSYDGILFTDAGGGKFINTESAVAQLERYQRWNTLWADHNCSTTISFDRDEIPAIVDWLDRNWDAYLSCSFLARTDPTKTAADLGHPYLPQEVVGSDDFFAYKSQLRAVDWDRFHTGWFEIADASDCSKGACPNR